MDANLALDAESRDKLKLLLENEETVCAGQLFVMGLDSLKEEIGDRWSRYRDRIYEVLERELKRVLEASEVFLRVGSGKYIIVFHDRDQATAQAVCQQILNEVRKTFLGSAELKNLGVDSMVMALNTSAFAKSMGLDLDEKTAANARKAGGENPAPKGEFEVTPESIWYLPIWDLRKELVYSYEPTILRTDGRRRLIGYAALPDQNDLKQIRALDLVRVGTGLKRLSSLVSTGTACVMSIPVHYKTLDNGPTRVEFHRSVLSATEAARKSVMFKLSGMTPGRPPWVVSEIVTMLRQLGRVVMVEVTPDWENLRALGGLPIQGLEVNLGRVTSVKGQLVRNLERTAAFCDEHRMVLSVSNVTNAAVAQLARDSGARWLSGHAILGAIDRPQPPMNFRQLANTALLSSAGGDVIFDDRDFEDSFTHTRQRQ